MSQIAKRFEPVDASPTKSFFVSMLTRDIKLEDAILDLLDNCVDGILRSKRHRSTNKPYAGFWAKIEFNRDSFSISDNCGGIPWDLHPYAFRMGSPKDRPRDPAGTVGVYGIGMKRAIFKMGEHCLISTQNGADGYEVEIKPEWIVDEDDWNIPVRQAKRSAKEDGTTIVIGKLYSNIASLFGADAEAFISGLRNLVATHYAFIIGKGFEIEVNGNSVKPIIQQLRFSDSPRGIKPFIFKTKTEGVEVFLMVGIIGPIPSKDDAIDEKETRYSSDNAGWTIVCNDRAVLDRDKTELTGWGETGIPRYHTQFITISGIVEFKSDDASKLPTTTTKRGINANSTLYLQIKNKMREGMRLFTDYTNKWKGRADESKRYVEEGKLLSFEEIKIRAQNLPLNSTKRTIPAGLQFRPSLPIPKELESRLRRMSFVKDIGSIEDVARYIKIPHVNPSAVGEKCFDLILEEVK